MTSTCTSFLTSTNTPKALLALPLFITPHEDEEVHLIAHENSVQEVSERLYYSYETPNRHRKKMLIKMALEW